MMQLKNYYKYALIGIFVIIVMVAAYFYVSRSDIVKNGDIVEIDYTGYLEDGTVFDTTVESIAKDPNIPKADTFKLKILYQPWQFEVGAHKTFPSLESAILGMRTGDTKEVRIPPEEVKGPKDPKLIITTDRVTTQPLRSSLDKTQFEEIAGEPPAVGKIYRLGDLLVKVEEITDKEVKFFHQIEKDMTFETPYGTATILSISDKDFTFRVDAVVGKKVSFQGNIGLVTEVTNDKITIDFNDPLAGHVLIFRITLLKIIKG